jgi:polyisoprenoid-binding protein YceI
LRRDRGSPVMTSLISILVFLAIALGFGPVSFAATAVPAPKASVRSETLVRTELSLANAQGSVRFLAIGKPSALKIQGEGPKPEGNLFVAAGQVSGELSLALDQLSSGIKLRDEHLKNKYLEVEKFPKAVLKVTSFEYPAAWAAGKDGEISGAPFQGMLSLHGVEKPINGLISASLRSKKIDCDATFKIRITDFGVDIPKFAGITVAEDVDLSIQIQGIQAQ